MIKFCSLFSGSSGNCIFFSSRNTNILIDVGGSGKRITEALNLIEIDPSDINAILISHEHIDHTKGAGILSERFDIPVYANEKTWNAMSGDVVKKIKLRNRKLFDTGMEFCVDDINVLPFSIPHDASDPVGFSIFAENTKISTATDIGHVNDELLCSLEGSDIILIEANHDIEMLRCGPYPWELKRRIMGDNGHLSNDAAAEVVAALAKKGTKRFLLGHLSKENNFPELAYQTVCNYLNKNDIYPGEDILLDVAVRDKLSKMVRINN